MLSSLLLPNTFNFQVLLDILTIHYFEFIRFLENIDGELLGIMKSNSFDNLKICFAFSIQFSFSWGFILNSRFL